MGPFEEERGLCEDLRAILKKMGPSEGHFKDLRAFLKRMGVVRQALEDEGFISIRNWAF